MKNKAALYFEAHVTIDPVFDARRAEAERIAERDGFKLAKLYMLKTEGANLSATEDTFMTGHGQHYDALQSRLTRLICALHNCGFKVRRYKIEDTIIDSRHADVLRLLGHACAACSGKGWVYPAPFCEVKCSHCQGKGFCP